MTWWMNCCDSPVGACRCDREGDPDFRSCAECGELVHLTELVPDPDDCAETPRGKVCRPCREDIVAMNADWTRREAEAVAEGRRGDMAS